MKEAYRRRAAACSVERLQAATSGDSASWRQDNFRYVESTMNRIGL